MALGTMHFNNLLVKQGFPSQRSRFDSRSGKLLCMEKNYFDVRLLCWWKSISRLCWGLGLAYRLKWLVFACLAQNLRWGWKGGVWRRGGIKNIFRQKEFLINSEVQNSMPRMSSLSKEENFHCPNIHLDLRKGGSEYEWRRTVVNFEIKISAG